MIIKKANGTTKQRNQQEKAANMFNHIHFFKGTTPTSPTYKETTGNQVLWWVRSFDTDELSEALMDKQAAVAVEKHEKLNARWINQDGQLICKWYVQTEDRDLTS